MRKKIDDATYRAALRKAENINILRSVGRRYSKQIDRDELLRCRLMALWRTLQYHEDGRGQAFTTNLYRFMEYECRNCLDGLRRRRPLEVLPADLTTAPAEQTPAFEVGDLLGALDPDTRELVRLYYLDGWSVADLARKQRRSKEWVRRQLREALGRMRAAAGVSTGCPTGANHEQD